MNIGISIGTRFAKAKPSQKESKEEGDYTNRVSIVEEKAKKPSFSKGNSESPLRKSLHWKSYERNPNGKPKTAKSWKE